MLSVAKILKSHGTDGGVLIGLSGAGFEEISQKEPVYIFFDGLPVPYFISDPTPKGSGRMVVHLTDVENLEDAEELVGKEIFLDSESVEDDEPDFAGWTVLDKGVKLGVVSDYEPIPGNPCLYVETPSGQVMVPLHKDFVIEIDEESGALNLDLPAGLY